MMEAAPSPAPVTPPIGVAASSSGPAADDELSALRREVAGLSGLREEFAKLKDYILEITMGRLRLRKEFEDIELRKQSLAQWLVTSTEKIDQLITRFTQWGQRIDSDFREFHDQVREWQTFLANQREILKQEQLEWRHEVGAAHEAIEAEAEDHDDDEEHEVEEKKAAAKASKALMKAMKAMKAMPMLAKKPAKKVQPSKSSKSTSKLSKGSSSRR